jgi:hypothetical protein
MGKYKDYNIIPIGDHCAISMILKELGLRNKSYPFDWVSHTEQVHDTNILHNIQFVDELTSTEDVDQIATKYIGDAFKDSKKINSNNIWFPHDSDNINETFEKYKRRFQRIKQDLTRKNIFILLTRHYYIEEDIFQEITTQLMNYNDESIILFISGTNHVYFENINCPNVIFKFIEYDISKFYDYAYSTFRPNIKTFLSELLL